MGRMLSRRTTRRRLCGVVLSAALLSGAAAFGTSTAAPLSPMQAPQLPDTGSGEGPDPAEPTEPPAARTAIERIEPITDRWLRVFVDSPAMSRTVEVQVLLPRDQSKPRPTVYMLDGRATEPNSSNWIDKAGAVDFYEDKDVNAVFTVGGPASFYTDWQQPDPMLGTNMWETFLTRELPPLINAKFNGNGVNAVMGISMGAEAAMMLATRRPALYSAVAAHSGCFSMGTDVGQAQARATVASYQGEPDNMFGRPDDPEWLAHDVMLHAEALRGKAIYLSVGSGLPGQYDVPDSNPDYASAISVGGPLEAATNVCTQRLAARLIELNIPVTTHFRLTGTHAWPYWTEELTRSWPTVAGALGV